MRYLAQLFCWLAVCHALCGQPADAVAIAWVRPSSSDDVSGTFIRSVDGVEIYTFRQGLCMVSYEPRRASSENDDAVILGMTEGSRYLVSDLGTITVEKSALLSQDVHFALIRWNGGEGLLRMDGASDRPPTEMSRSVLEVLAYKKQKAAEPGATDNPDDAQRFRENH